MTCNCTQDEEFREAILSPYDFFQQYSSKRPVDKNSSACASVAITERIGSIHRTHKYNLCRNAWKKSMGWTRSMPHQRTPPSMLDTLWCCYCVARRNQDQYSNRFQRRNSKYLWHWPLGGSYNHSWLIVARQEQQPFPVFLCETSPSYSSQCSFGSVRTGSFFVKTRIQLPHHYICTRMIRMGIR